MWRLSRPVPTRPSSRRSRSPSAYGLPVRRVRPLCCVARTPTRTGRLSPRTGLRNEACVGLLGRHRRSEVLAWGGRQTPATERSDALDAKEGPTTNCRPSPRPTPSSRTPS
ncbi:MAG: hypothetical protein MZV70_54435 [Desulfobacterales bacterium]|nr:hypothetical protein [Desulfobacterales bacterium]